MEVWDWLGQKLGVINPSKLDEVVTLLPYIWEMPGLNLGWDTSSPGLGFSCFSSVSRQMLE
jgi:hypothetical protein